MSDEDARRQATARALSSPLRLRILRYCLYEARSNREIAAEFDLNPGTSLHHVRTLVDAGFLAAEEGRPGRRGSVEIPYRATGLSWNADLEGRGDLLVRTFLAEIEGRDLDELFMVRMGFKLRPEREDELRRRLVDIVLEYHRSPDDDGEASSLFIAGHPEALPARRQEPGSA
jgi:hypothetical protein